MQMHVYQIVVKEYNEYIVEISSRAAFKYTMNIHVCICICEKVPCMVVTSLHVFTEYKKKLFLFF